MELTVLGCSGSYGAPAGGACSGYLVRAGDATSGWTAATARSPTCSSTSIPADLTAVVITHGHADHCVDIYGLHVMYRYGLERSGLPVYAPEGLEQMLEELVGAFGDTFDWRIVGDGDTRHDRRRRSCASRAPTIRRRRSAVEIAHDGKRLVYTADTGPEWSVDAFGAGRRPRALGGDVPARRHPRADPPLGAPSRRGGARREGAPADAHPFVADARPGSLRRRGLGGVRAARSRSRRRTSARTSEPTRPRRSATEESSD